MILENPKEKPPEGIPSRRHPVWTHAALETGHELGLVGHLSGVKLVVRVDGPLSKILILSLVRLSWNWPRKPRKGLLVTIVWLGKRGVTRPKREINGKMMIY